MMVEQGGIVAHLQWQEPVPDNPLFGPDPVKLPKMPGNMSSSIFGQQKRAKAVITARLLDQQYTDIYALPKGGRVMVKGRLFEMNNDVSQIVIKDALLFSDRDWSKGAILADPNVMLMCPAAVNDVTGTAGAYQPGAFGQHSPGH
jgi:hypothetical protein